MELNRENPADGTGSEDLFSGTADHEKGEIFIEKELHESADEEDEEDIENWGVYIQGKEKTLLGLFWDKELAGLFMNSVKNSKVLEKVLEIA